MKKLIGLFGVLTFAACGGTEVYFVERDVPTSPDKKIVDDVQVPGVDAGNMSTLADSAVDAQVDASVAYDAATDSSSTIDAAMDADDSSDGALPPAPELAHPECECHSHLFECRQAFPDLNIDCGTEPNCVDTPYYTITIYGTQVGHRLVVGDPRQGCAVLGVQALCCSH